MKNFNEIFNRISETEKRYVEETTKEMAKEIAEEDGDIQLMNIATSLRNIAKISGKDCVRSKDYYDIYLDNIAETFEKIAIGGLNIKKHESGFNFNL